MPRWHQQIKIWAWLLSKEIVVRPIWGLIQTETVSLWRWIQHQSWQLLPRNRLRPSSCGLSVWEMVIWWVHRSGLMVVFWPNMTWTVNRLSKFLVICTALNTWLISSCSWIIILKILLIFYTSGRKMLPINCVRIVSFKMLLEIWNVIFQSFVQRLRPLFMAMRVIVTLLLQPQDWFIWLIGILYV